MRSVDLTGRRFNHLTVQYKVSVKSPFKWHCICDCGREIDVLGANLQREHTKSCGCFNNEVRQRKRKDLVGRVFGQLTVLSYVGNLKWRCQCSCGTYLDVLGGNLRKGHTKSCGCSKAQIISDKLSDYILNETYGRLTAIKYVGRGKWLCQCSCGNTTITSAYYLKTGHTKSCGCWKIEVSRQKEDLTGRVFGELTVIKDKGNHKWLCQCSCGKQVVVFANDLRRGQTRSCGHLREDFYRRTQDKLEGKRFGKLTALTFLGLNKWHCQCDCGNFTISKGADLKSGKIQSCGCVKSKGEKELLSFVTSVYQGEVLSNDRKTISPKELDVYIPEKKLAVEYNGLYWHSEAAGKKQMYHWHKTKACIDKGIRLVQFYDVEWHNQQEICKSMIRSALGVYERREYARNCVVMEIWDKQTVIDFFNENHIQGAVHKFSCALGLYKGDELLQAVVFGKQHFGRNGDYELYRMVTKKNTQVLGGFSRLMKYCPYDTVVSYVDLRLFDARGYLAGGWKIEKRANPTFCITDGLNRFSRHEFKKSECLKRFDNVTEDMTESEMQIANGFYRVWNSGTYRVRWTRS